MQPVPRMLEDDGTEFQLRLSKPRQEESDAQTEAVSSGGSKQDFPDPTAGRALASPSRTASYDDFAVSRTEGTKQAGTEAEKSWSKRLRTEGEGINSSPTKRARTRNEDAPTEETPEISKDENAETSKEPEETKS